MYLDAVRRDRPLQLELEGETMCGRRRVHFNINAIFHHWTHHVEESHI